MAFIVIQVYEPPSAPFWTLASNAGAGDDLREAHRFLSKQEAQDMANLLNATDLPPGKRS